MNDGLNFFLRMREHEDTIYFWMTVLGDQELSLGYNFKLGVKKEIDHRGRMVSEAMESEMMD